MRRRRHPGARLVAIVKRVAGKISEDRLLAEAAGVTFYALLAVFPALAALVSLYGLFADPTTIADQIKGMSGVLPGGGMSIITQQVHSLASKQHTARWASAWPSASSPRCGAPMPAIKALFDALNVVYEEHETRSYPAPDR